MNSAMTGEVKCVAPMGDVCGEGAVWHAAENAVYWVDINRFLIHRYRLADAAVFSWIFEVPVTALSLTDRDDVLLVVLGSQVMLWEPATDTRHPPLFKYDAWPGVRLNDARSDPRGSLWMGSMRNNIAPDGSAIEFGGTDGVLMRLDADGKTSVWRKDIGISNTFVWSPDRRHFYFADSIANVIWVYDYDFATGAISNERPFFEGFDRGLPDGSAMDSEGFLWNCRYYGNCVVRVAPDGKVDRVVEMPVKNITTCCFGGEDLRTLFVTTASAHAALGDRLAGSLFAIRTEVKGQAENRFKLRLKSSRS
ncbi:MAG TPA: SMP-30/gluconolactonase/LRE family protein [Candidatus Acidoferrales bacterium]